MNETRASLTIGINVDCPNCGEFLNLMDESEMGLNLNEDGYLLGQACGNGHWVDLHKKFSVDDIECPKCHASFNVKELEW